MGLDMMGKHSVLQLGSFLPKINPLFMQKWVHYNNSFENLIDISTTFDKKQNGRSRKC
jgi:hypothetical protein